MTDGSAVGPASGRTSGGWEAFGREGEGELRHVGHVDAPTREMARERAIRLCGWSADEVWLCPTAELIRVEVGTDAGESPTETSPEATADGQPGDD